MRLGLFGGTFNPIHHGHLRAAVEVKEAFDLEKIVMIPAAVPPHKQMAGIASASDRLRMVQAATANVPFLEASDMELARPGPSYSVDTLRTFRDQYPAPSVIFFILGTDAFAEISTWKSYRDLFALADFIIMERKGVEARSLGAFIHEQISGDYALDREFRCFRHPQWHTIHRLAVTCLDISATAIRKKIKMGRSIRFLVPDEVEALIYDKGLFI